VSATRRLIVVLPELAPDAPTHYAHYLPLMREVSKLANTALVVETGSAPELPSVEVIGQRRVNPVARAAELARILVSLRRRGYRAAYGSYSPYFGVVGGLLGRLIGIRTAYWHCRSDFFDRKVSRKLDIRRVLLDTLPFVLSLHMSRRVVTGTDGLAGLYADTFKLPRSKLRVVPNDIDVGRWRTPGRRYPDGSRTILFVHRLSEHQGSRILRPIYREVSRRVPEVRLIIAGGGPDQDRVRAEMDAELRSGQVTLLGYVANPEVRSLMSEADVLLMPSLTEGFPRVLLEAMAVGLPFVAADVGGVAEVVGTQARRYLVPPGDVDRFASTLARLLLDRSLRASLAEEGLRRVARYDVTSVAPLLVDAVCE
jgi:glycosyltransferase involved in cell wall biosynthesis